LYRALEALEDVLDHDLDSAERARLEQRLHRIAATAQHADVRELAHALRTFVQADTRQVVATEPGRWHRHRSRGAAWVTRHITQRRFKLALVAGLMVTGVPGGVALLVLVLEGVLSVALPPDLRAALLTVGQGARSADHAWAPVRLGVESVTGVPLVIAASLLLLGHDRRGLRLSRAWLVMSLTIVNLLMFYFDQFGAVVDAVLNGMLLVGVVQYQRRYVRNGTPIHHVTESS
jgi:hypothetical protein